MKRSLVLSCGAVMSVLSFYACSSSDDSMVTPLTRSDAVSEKIVFPTKQNGACAKKVVLPGANIYPKVMIRLMYTMGS